MVTVVQGKVCAKNHPDRLSRLATIHQRYRRTDGRISYGIGLDLTVGQKVYQVIWHASNDSNLYIIQCLQKSIAFNLNLTFKYTWRQNLLG